MIRYLRDLSRPRLVLWSYLIWYVSVLVRYFDPSPRLWLNSLGISAIIGTGLYLSTAYSTSPRTPLNRWQVFRLYLMPFCVSSFASLIKGRGFVLVFYPTMDENQVAALFVLTFWAVVLLLKATSARRPALS